MRTDNVIIRYLSGSERLWPLFWIWGVIGSWILFAVFYWALTSLGITWVLFIIAALIMGPYTVWILASIWQCAGNVHNALWGDLARLATVVWALNIGVTAGLLLKELVLR